MSKLDKLIMRGSLAVASLSPTLVIAAEKIPDVVEPISGGSDLTVAGIIKSLITFILAFAAAIAVLFLIIGGILYMTSGGNDEKIKKAKSMIFSAIIGVVVILLSFIIVNFVTKQAEDVKKNAETESR